MSNNTIVYLVWQWGEYESRQLIGACATHELACQLALSTSPSYGRYKRANLKWKVWKNTDPRYKYPECIWRINQKDHLAEYISVEPIEVKRNLSDIKTIKGN